MKQHASKSNVYNSNAKEWKKESKGRTPAMEKMVEKADLRREDEEEEEETDMRE